MRQSIERFFFILVVGLVSAATVDARSPLPAEDGELEGQDREAIVKVLTEQVEAWNAHDLERFMETYWKSEQLSFSSGGQTTRGWQATLDRYRSRYAEPEQMGRLAFSDLEVRRLGPQTAFVLGRWQLERRDEKMQGNFTLIVRKMDTGWKIVHDHTSLEEER